METMRGLSIFRRLDFQIGLAPLLLHPELSTWRHARKHVRAHG